MIDFIIALIMLGFVAAVAYHLGKRAGARTTTMPIVLAQNEGFSIRSVAVPATGTWQVAINVDWTEVTAY